MLADVSNNWQESLALCFMATKRVLGVLKNAWASYRPMDQKLGWQIRLCIGLWLIHGWLGGGWSWNLEKGWLSCLLTLAFKCKGDLLFSVCVCACIYACNSLASNCQDSFCKDGVTSPPPPPPPPINPCWLTFYLTKRCYRGLQLGWHKITTRICM